MRFCCPRLRRAGEGPKGSTTVCTRGERIPLTPRKIAGGCYKGRGRDTGGKTHQCPLHLLRHPAEIRVEGSSLEPRALLCEVEVTAPAERGCPDCVTEEGVWL